ncbi:sigma-70 family RNA polymerase sigma factor [Ligilactobacillus ruminis]|uniref:sigma-70 family RNA polymerase sigma factor n=1 Tax=Ligilactobacillus ruminis TaxID=1623 RepID=UPI0009BB3802|nr:sigma-70 family RNA polymerase sigma factor [Ligilactobacillus ruminis]
MKIKVKYENYNENKDPITVEIDVPDDECTVMVELDYQRRLSAAEDDEVVERRDAQTIMDEEFNKPLYNNWHKEHRHRGNLKKQFHKEDEDADESDGLDTVGDYSQEEERNRQYEYEALCQKLRTVLKPEYAEVIIAVCLDELTPEKYAATTGEKRDTVYKRLQRAKKKFQEFLQDCPI